jgi:hypothetical protein
LARFDDGRVTVVATNRPIIVDEAVVTALSETPFSFANERAKVDWSR